MSVCLLVKIHFLFCTEANIVSPLHAQLHTPKSTNCGSQPHPLCALGVPLVMSTWGGTSLALVLSPSTLCQGCPTHTHGSLAWRKHSSLSHCLPLSRCVLVSSSRNGCMIPKVNFSSWKCSPGETTWQQVPSQPCSAHQATQTAHFLMIAGLYSPRQCSSLCLCPVTWG